MNILITGATGFVGSWISKKLVEEGHRVSVLRRENSDISQISHLDLEHRIGDVTDLESLKRALDNIECVFHLAGVVGYSKSMRMTMDKVNVLGTENMVQACKDHDVKRMLYMSSVVAIGASFDGKEPLNETSSYNVSHLNLGYFETKKQAELIVKKACEAQQLEAVIVNPSTIYGPGDALKGSRNTQVKVAKGKMPFYTSGGVSIIHIEDLIDATYKAFQLNKSGERYILSGENITIKKLFELIAEAAGVEAPRIHLPNFLVHGIGAVGDLLENINKKGPLSSENAWTATMYHWFDCSKAKKDLGLNVRPAKDSINDSVQWMKENGVI
jgi:dihydroflavonol-4-reductase